MSALRNVATLPSTDLVTWPHGPTSDCSVIFQTIAADCVRAIRTNRQRAIAGHGDAVHSMRIELTRLRAAALFFNRWIPGGEWPPLNKELDWLNSVLGRARNVDVTVEYSACKQYRHWAGSSRRKLLRLQDEAHRQLAKELRSARYSRLISGLDRWLNKLLSPGDGNAVDDFYEKQLSAWRNELATKGRHVTALSRKQQHRLRIQSKNYRYVVESLLALDVPLSREDFAFCDTAKRVHRALGDLRDLRRLRKSVGRRPPHYRKHRCKMERRVKQCFRQRSDRH